MSSAGGSGRQPGSTFKPLVLAANFEAGYGAGQRFVAPGEITLDIPPEPWTVSNAGGRDYGTLTLFEGTVNSVNTVYAQALAQVGPEAVADLADRDGRRSRARSATLHRPGNRGGHAARAGHRLLDLRPLGYPHRPLHGHQGGDTERGRPLRAGRARGDRGPRSLRWPTPSVPSSRRSRVAERPSELRSTGRWRPRPGRPRTTPMPGWPGTPPSTPRSSGWDTPTATGRWTPSTASGSRAARSPRRSGTTSWRSRWRTSNRPSSAHPTRISSTTPPRRRRSASRPDDVDPGSRIVVSGKGFELCVNGWHVVVEGPEGGVKPAESPAEGAPAPPPAGEAVALESAPAEVDRFVTQGRAGRARKRSTRRLPGRRGV